MSNNESWATRTVSAHLACGWYSVAEDMVEELAREENTNPFNALADRLEQWVEEGLTKVHCPKRHCGHQFEISGVAQAIIVAFLHDADWDAIAKEYEEDMIREGGIKLDDYEWRWDCDDA